MVVLSKVAGRPRCGGRGLTTILQEVGSFAVCDDRWLDESIDSFDSTRVGCAVASSLARKSPAMRDEDNWILELMSGNSQRSQVS